MERKVRTKAKGADQLSFFRVSLELCKTALGAMIRAVVTYWLKHRQLKVAGARVVPAIFVSELYQS